MKRSTCLFLCILLLFSLITLFTACGEDDVDTTPTAPTSTATPSSEPSASDSSSSQSSAEPSASASSEASTASGNGSQTPPIDPSDVFDGSLDPNGWT